MLAILEGCDGQVYPFTVLAFLVAMGAKLEAKNNVSAAPPAAL